MNRTDRSRPSDESAQASGDDPDPGRGAASCSATVLGLFAMNVGIFAQRTSAADLRTRVMRETLEAALAQGVEYIKNNRKVVVTNALAHPCTATDLTFPCGTVPQCATATSAADSSGSTSDGSTACTGDLPRRGKMYAYTTPSGSVL